MKSEARRLASKKWAASHKDWLRNYARAWYHKNKYKLSEKRLASKPVVLNVDRVITHRWINNVCMCGAVRTGYGKYQSISKDGVQASYIVCSRPFPEAGMYYHTTKNSYPNERTGTL